MALLNVRIDYGGARHWREFQQKTRPEGRGIMAINVVNDPLPKTMQSTPANHLKLTFVIAWFFCLLF